MTLAKLKVGETAIIQSVEADEMLTKRMQALGFRTNKLIKVIRTAIFGGPLQVQIGTTDIILRSDIAELIRVVKM